jgi:hypothetical protein
MTPRKLSEVSRQRPEGSALVRIFNKDRSNRVFLHREGLILKELTHVIVILPSRQGGNFSRS